MFLGRDRFYLADHVMRGHLGPFIKVYINHLAFL